MKTKLFLSLLFLSLTTHALSIDPRYLATSFEINNHTSSSQTIQLFDSEGVWAHSWITKSSFLLLPNQSYHNTLLSIAQNHHPMNTTSIVVSNPINPKHYFIFASSNLSQSHYISGDIVDGLGATFTNSWTNGCKATGPHGEDFCKIDILEGERAH